MRATSLVALALLAAPAFAIELVELRDGRVLEAERVHVRTESQKLYIQLHVPKQDQHIAFTLPFAKIVPEFVYYAWARQTRDEDFEGHVELARWSRGEGLFQLAWRQYEAAGEWSDDFKKTLPELKKEMFAEEAKWHFDAAERFLREDEVSAARRRAQQLRDAFAGTPEAERANELLALIGQREAALTKEKAQRKIEKRARRHRRTVDRQLSRIEAAARRELNARFSNPGDALRRLRSAAYTYRRAAIEFEQLLLIVEVDELRTFVRNLHDDVSRRMMRSFMKLADLRFLLGDTPGALDAVHEVLDLDPGHKAASGLREKILDRPTGRAPDPVYVDSGYRSRIFLPRYFTRRHCGLRSTGLHTSGFGIRIGHTHYPYR